MEACRVMRGLLPARSLDLLRGAAAAAAGAPFRLRPPMAIPMTTASGGWSRRRAYDGLLLDAGGTLLQVARPVGETYASIGRKYGLKATENEIKQGFKKAFAATWPEKLRYQGDGRAFWRLVVSEATGCTDNDYFEEVYEHYAKGDAWRLPVGAYEAMCILKDAGGHISQLAVVSNFDTRLRKLLKDLDVVHIMLDNLDRLEHPVMSCPSTGDFFSVPSHTGSILFDAIIISSEVGYEKPAAEIFRAALDQLDIAASKAVHVGDDEKADKNGANAIGIDCWLWGSDVKTFTDICDRIVISDSQ